MLPSLPIRVVIADDHAAFARGIERMLEDAGMHVVAVVADGDAALVACAEHEPDVAVLDLRMPGRSGRDVARALRELRATSRTLILSAFAEPETVEDALGAGADGYLRKDAPRAIVVEAVARTARGEAVRPLDC